MRKVIGFLKKDVSPWDLESAIRNVMQSGYCYTNNMTGKLINLFRKSQEQSAIMNSMLSDMEMTFLKYSCSDMTYDENQALHLYLLVYYLVSHQVPYEFGESNH